MTDFVGRFDHLDPDMMVEPYSVYRELRECCPVAHSDAYEENGFFVLSRYGDVHAAAQQPKVFCSSRRASIPVLPAPQLIPIEMDPPEHLKYRSLLTPAFAPGRVAELEPTIRDEANALIDEFIESGECDLVHEFARPLAMRILARILDLPLGDMDPFHAWVDAMAFQMHLDPEGALQAAAELYGYLAALLTNRREAPGNDLISALITSEVEGERLTDDEILNVLVLFVLAGLDTTATAIAGSVEILDRNPAARRRLLADASLLPMACEEFLRLVSPIQSMARTVTEQTDLAGHVFHDGDRVLLLWGSANRDDRQFDDPDELIIDRQPNRHLAFGAGVHRCLGSHLGRLQLRVALEQILNRMPEFRVTDPTKIEWAVGHARGIRMLPLAF